MTDNQSAIRDLKLEWEKICSAMDRGHWYGSEQSAIEAIADIKRKIQALESTPIDRVTYGAFYTMHGEQHSYRANSLEELDILIFGQAYAPSRGAVSYWQEGAAS